MKTLTLSDHCNDRTVNYTYSNLDRCYNDKVNSELEYWLGVSDMYYKGYYPIHMENSLWNTFKTFVPHLNVFNIRVRTLESVFLDHRFNTQQKPFTLTPSPVSKLSYNQREIIAELIMDEFKLDNFINVNGQSALTLINSKGFNDLVDAYSKMGKSILSKEAQEASIKMENLMYDQLVQSNFKQNVFSSLISNIAKYPVAISKGATIVPTNNLTWDRRNRTAFDMGYSIGFQSVNPYDIFFTNDAKKLQDSSCIVEVSYHNIADIATMLKDEYVSIYDKNRLEKALNKIVRSSNKCWMGFDGYQFMKHEIIKSPSYNNWLNSTSIPKINMTKVALGIEIKHDMFEPTKDYFGNKLPKPDSRDIAPNELDDYTPYIVEVEIIADEVIRCTYKPYVSGGMGYYASSYVNDPNKIVGTGLCELIKSEQDEINDWMISMCRAVQWESRGLTVIDPDLIDSADLPKTTTLQPGATIKFGKKKNTSDNANRGMQLPVTRINPNTQNHRNIYQTIKEHMQVVDEISGIHGSLSGIARSASENRVGSIYTTKLTSAMKPVQMMANNFDINIIEPMMKSLYNYNMEYHWDSDVKGDSTVMIEGATGMLRRNLKQENSQLTLQLVQAGVQSGAFPNDIVRNVLVEMIRENGYDIENEEIKNNIAGTPQANDIIEAQQQIDVAGLPEANNPIGNSSIPDVYPNVQTVETQQVIDETNV